MTCRAARTTIPLLAGEDLSPRRARRTERHCAACPDCRRELAGIRAARDRVRAAAAAEGRPDFDAAAWAALMTGIAAERPVPQPASSPRMLRPRLAGALAAVAAIAAAGLLFRGLSVPPQGRAAVMGALTVPADDIPLRIMGRPEILMPGAGSESARRPQPVLTARREAPPPAGPQDVISVTLVSEESGLLVNWVFNRNFEWKGDRP